MKNNKNVEMFFISMRATADNTTWCAWWWWWPR